MKVTVINNKQAAEVGDILIGKQSNNKYLIIKQFNSGDKFALLNLSTNCIYGQAKTIDDLLIGVLFEDKIYKSNEIELILG